MANRIIRGKEEQDNPGVVEWAVGQPLSFPKQQNKQYNVAFSCSECGRPHATKVYLTYAKKFATGTTIRDVYNREPLPRDVIKLLRNPALCPVTRNSVVLDHAEKLYLVPAE
jgi:hypothetical protein